MSFPITFDPLTYHYTSRRNVVYAANGMVCTGNPLAAQAGLDVLRRGGNAIDAAVAVASTLTVVEPTANGIGSDAFAIVYTGGKLYGLPVGSSSSVGMIYNRRIFEEAHLTVPEDMEELRAACDKLWSMGVVPLYASDKDAPADQAEGMKVIDPEKFEAYVMSQAGLPEQIIPRYRTTYFNHIFSGGYSAGYYGYLWAEVLDKDAFELFRKKGVFNAATALSFRKNILEKGGSEEPMVLYRRFLGADPDPDALLRARGLE